MQFYIFSQELVEEEKEQKNWKGIGIALLVIVVVFSCVAVAVVLVTPGQFSEANIRSNPNCMKIL